MSKLGSDPTRVCVIFNPTAKGGGARRTQSRLNELGESCSFKPTFAAGSARLLAAEAVREGFGTIVAMGGDGTVNEVLNGLAEEPGGLLRARLALLPVGTVNVFARELKIPFHFHRAWEVVSRGRELSIDLPAMEFQVAGGRERRWFAQMAGCGLDARAVELMNWQHKRRFGQFAYVVSAFKALRERPTFLSVSDGKQRLSGQLVLLGNGRLYGGPIPVFDRAELTDGLLDVCIFPKVDWFVVLRYACAYLSPKLLWRRHEIHLQAASVTIASSVPAPVEVDGELVGQLPAVCTILRRALRVVVP